MTSFQVRPYSNISPIGLEKFDETNCSVTETSETPDGILVRSTKLNEGHIGSSLRAISRAGAGVNNIPVELCTDRGVVVFNTPGANANAVKELVLCGLLLASRGIIPGIGFASTQTSISDEAELSKLMEQEKKKFKGSEISGKTLGVIGKRMIGWRAAFL